jgi:hypothetical protein
MALSASAMPSSSTSAGNLPSGLHRMTSSRSDRVGGARRSTGTPGRPSEAATRRTKGESGTPPWTTAPSLPGHGTAAAGGPVPLTTGARRRRGKRGLHPLTTGARRRRAPGRPREARARRHPRMKRLSSGVGSDAST